MPSKAIASFFEVKTVEDCGGYPRVIINAEVALANKGGIVESVDTKNIRAAVEAACATYVKVEEVKK